MSVHALGALAPLTARFYDAPGGAAIDPEALSLSISRDQFTTLGPVDYPVGIVRESLGVYRYDWTVPTTIAPGDYDAAWTATMVGGVQVGHETLTLIAGGLVEAGGVNRQTWATAADVAALTDVVVTDLTVAQANATLELLSGRIYAIAASRTGNRDAEWMRRACAYQAAWLVQQPDAFQRTDLTNLSASGRGLALTTTGLVLAPLARWALRRVSWLKSRSLHVRSPFQDGLGPVSPNAVSEVNDAFESFVGFDGGSGSFGNDEGW